MKEDTGKAGGGGEIAIRGDFEEALAESGRSQTKPPTVRHRTFIHNIVERDSGRPVSIGPGSRRYSTTHQVPLGVQRGKLTITTDDYRIGHCVVGG